MALFGSLVKLWPYNLSLTLKWYDFARPGTDGWGPYFNSLRLAALVAVIGTAIIFCGAYLVEKGRGAGCASRRRCISWPWFRWPCPALCWALAYIFFFNAPGNPLNFIYSDHDNAGGRTRFATSTRSRWPSDGRHSAEAGRQRIRIWRCLAEGAALPDTSGG